MCQDRNDVPVVAIDVHERILSRNDRTAAHNREHFRERQILCINLMGGPGSGKTAILEATARAFGGKRLGAIAGDLATDNDAARLAAAGIRSLAIQTGQACHLDAEMVHEALHHFDLDGLDFLFIENVGNLVCPAVYDLGQTLNVVALSVTEGEDKPLKYPTMFAKADLVLLTKLDLLVHLGNVELAKIEDAISHVMPQPRVVSVSAVAEFGVSWWTDWLREQRELLVGEVVA